MKNNMSVKLSGCFYLVVGFLLLLSPFAGNAQNNSVINMVETEWVVRVPVQRINPVDNSVTKITRYYKFYEKGKVKATDLIEKTAGLKMDYVYNSATAKNEWMHVPTMSEVNYNNLFGTYKVSGKSISIDLPDGTISASVFGDYIQGTVLYKENNSKAEWRVDRARASSQNSPSNEISVQSNIQSAANTEKDNNTGTGIAIDPRTFAAGMDAETARKAQEEARRIEAEAKAAEEAANRRKAEAEALLVGRWKHSEFIPNSNYLKKEIVISFSKDGLAASSSQNYSSSITVNWKWTYTPVNDSSGVMELYVENKLVEKANVKWITKNQFEYVVTFFDHVTTFGWSVSNFVGDKFIFKRQ